MKTKKQIEENTNGCKVKLQESYNNEKKFASVMTPKMRNGYRQTQNYIKGWISKLEDKQMADHETEEYKKGFTNAEKWLTQ